MGDLALAEIADILIRGGFAIHEFNPGAKFLAVFGVRHADHLHVCDLGMAVEILLDLARIQVLPAPDHQILDPADDVEIAVFVHGREVAGVHPAGIVDGFRGFLVIVPVAAHHQIAAGAELASRPDRNNTAGLVDNLYLHMGQRTAHRGDAAFELVMDTCLGRTRAGFGHAIGNRHLLHMHLVDHPAHDFDRTGRARHHAGAQTGQIEAFKFGVVELGDEHRRHTIKRGAAFRGDRLEGGQRVERIGRIDHGRTVGHSRQIADHHAETVVERHRNTDAVSLAVFQRLAQKEAVVENVVVGERCTLGGAGGARSKLDVDRVIELERRGQRFDGRVTRLCPHRHHIRKGIGAGDVRFTNLNNGLQMRQGFRRKFSRRGAVDLRRKLAQHAEIVTGLEPHRRHQRRAFDLVQGIFEFGQAIGRVDIDQHQAGLGRGELGDRPFRTIGRPDTDA